MSEKQGKGICMFVYNNEQLDYTKFSIVAALYAKHHMKQIPVTLITDEGTQGWIEQSIDETILNNAVDNIVIDNVEHEMNPRRHMDSPWTEFNAPFYNSNKHQIFNLTPYEKTLLIDTDFLICNNFYEYLFDSDIPVGMHRYAEYLGGDIPYLNEVTLNNAGINHWWSTVVYFDRSEESKLFFDIWAHVKDNWEYYSLLYQFPKALFRTDFCVSIASHMLNGMNNDNFVHDFLGKPLLNMDQKDDIAQVNGIGDIVFLKHKRSEQWVNYLCKHKNDNLHIMNKRALDRNYADLLSSFEGKQIVQAI